MRDGSEGHVPGAVRRRRPRHAAVEGGGAGQAFVGEPGLADTGRSVDDETVGARVGQRRLEQVEVFVPADQRPLERWRRHRVVARTAH
jgi:hypothetical protein